MGNETVAIAKTANKATASGELSYQPTNNALVSHGRFVYDYADKNQLSSQIEST